MSKDQNINPEDLARSADRLERVADLIHSAQLDIEQYSQALIDKHSNVENRRFAVVQSLKFHLESGNKIISIGAVLCGASVIQGYVQDGELPDLAKERQAAEEFTKAVVEGAFPASYLDGQS